MTEQIMHAAAPLRVFCRQDNPLIVFHTEHLLEDMGHVFAGFADSFSGLQTEMHAIDVSGALVDMDLSDGRTGPEAAARLRERGIPTVFVTGQDEIAAQHSHLSVAIIVKPISSPDLAAKIELFRKT